MRKEKMPGLVHGNRGHERDEKPKGGTANHNGAKKDRGSNNRRANAGC